VERKPEITDKEEEVKVLHELMDMEQCDPPSACDMEQPPSLEEAGTCCEEQELSKAPKVIYVQVRVKVMTVKCVLNDDVIVCH
jgi:hypothetical protein